MRATLSTLPALPGSEMWRLMPALVPLMTRWVMLKLSSTAADPAVPAAKDNSCAPW